MAIINPHQLSVFQHQKVQEGPAEVVERFQKIIQTYNLTPHDNAKREVYLQTIMQILETLDIPEEDLENTKKEINTIHSSAKFE